MRAGFAGNRPRRALAALTVLVAVTGHAPAAQAYAEPVHAAMPRWVFSRQTLEQRLAPVPPAALPRFRERFYALAANGPDPELNRRFRSRFPTAAGFDAAAFKEFLGLNPQASVWGIDRAPDRPQTLGEILAVAAAAPDNDGRNRDRLLRDRRGRAVRLADGSLVPVDPMVLAIGRPTGVTSQAHAHYGLANVPKSDDPNTLRTDPRRFASPPTIETYAGANAQLWTDMAILAGVWGQPTLAAVHEGAWQHFAEDVANQVHTVQVGIYDFFVDAKIQSILEWFWSLGGLLRAPKAFREIGITIVANHHLLGEGFFEKRMHEVITGSPRQAPQASKVLAALAEDDADLLRQLQAARHQDDWAMGMMERLSEVSSREGADLYRATRGWAKPEVSQGGNGAIAYTDDPDAYVRPAQDPEAAAALADYYRLYENAFRRAGTMLRQWRANYSTAIRQPGADQAAVTRIVRRQLQYWAAAEARRQVWLADKPMLGTPLAAK